MDPSRSERITDIMKNITGLGKSIKKPATLRYIQPEDASRLGQPVAGSQVVRILMIGLASLLLIGVILLCIDQWVTPIFQRTPGDGAYIPVPGMDPSELFWDKSTNVTDITIGMSDSAARSPPGSAGANALQTSVIENQGNYSITMDILIEDEYPQDLGSDATGNIQRTFFVLGYTNGSGSLPFTPALTVRLNNSQNTCVITAYDQNSQLQSVVIENVPIHTPFRIGISMSPYIMEGYLNGLLVKTRQLKTSTRLPITGSKIFAPANILVNQRVVSKGIKVRNVRCFGYTVTPSEMKGRMNDRLLNGPAW